MRKYNVKLFLILMAVAVVFVGGLFGVSYLQRPRIARALLWQARRQEDQGDTRKMAMYLQRYLEFVPTDLAERAHLGRTWASDFYEKEPRIRLRGIDQLTQVLTKDPSQPELRRIVVKTALDPRIHDTKIARDNLEILWNETRQATTTTNPQTVGEIESLWGQLLQAEEKPAEAISWYRQAVEHAPTEEISYVRLAYLLRLQKELNADNTAKNIAEADSLLDKLVQSNGLSYKAYLSRWQYRRDFHQMKVKGVLNPAKIEEYAEDVKKALERAPEEVEVLIAAADKERLLGTAKGDANSFGEHRDQARKYLLIGLQLQARPGYKGASEAAQFQLLWTLANLQLDVLSSELARNDEAGAKARQEVADAALTIDKLKAIKFSRPEAIQYLEAWLRLQQCLWGDSATLFQQAKQRLSDRPELLFQIDLFLAQCYEKLEQPNQMMAACEDALKLDPDSVAARVGMAKAQWALGHVDKAVKDWEKLTERDKVPVEELLDVARMQVQRQLIAQKPDWKQVENALDRAEKASVDNQHKWVDVQLLRAEMWASQLKYDKAKQVLEAAVQKYPKDVELWTARAFLRFKEDPKNPDSALDVLKEAEKSVGGDRVEFRLARARIAVKSSIAKPEEYLLKLKDGTEKYTAEDRGTLLEGLAEASYVLGAKAQARLLWLELAKLPQHQNDLRLQLMLFDVAMMMNDEPGMNRCLAVIRAIEGGEGDFNHLGQALRQIWLSRQESKDSPKAALMEARLQLNQIRSQWPRVELARAEIAQVTGNGEEAIVHLKKAIDLGETSPQVIKQLVDALVKRQQYAEADQELQRMRDVLVLNSNSELRDLAAIIALKQGDQEKAQKFMKMGASEPQSFRDLLWQARVLLLTKKDQEAFAKVQDAIKQAPAEPEPYVTQVQFFHARGKDIEARKTIKEAEAQILADTTERKAQRALALALCYETVGDVGPAATSYSEALSCGGSDMNVIRGVCSFYLKYGRMEEVGPLLETVVGGRVKCAPADLEWARQSLAYVLSATTDFSRFRRALDLVGVKLDDDGKLIRATVTDESTDAIRAKARVLATQPQPQFRNRAIELLVQLKERQSLLPDDRFVLAMLYEAQGDATGWSKAREELDAICRPIGQNERAEYLREAPRYMSRYIQGLIHHKDVVVARQWLANLETLEKQREVPPGTFGSVELQARLLEAENRGDEAIKVLNAYTRRPGGQPADVLLVVASYQRQMRWKEGFELLDQERDKIAPELVGGYYVSLMYGLKPTDIQCEKVEAWLKTQIATREKETQSLSNTRDKEDARNRGVALQMHLAALYDLRGRYPDAEGQYKKILQIEPNNVVALNNLAWLRAAQQTGEGNAALKDINTAIAGMGRQSLLLDTRGLVYMALNQNDKALADFKEASEDAPTPTVLFHLARAHSVVKDKNAAEAVLRQARKAGLEPAKLHPVEQAACSELLKELHVQ